MIPAPLSLSNDPRSPEPVEGERSVQHFPEQGPAVLARDPHSKSISWRGTILANLARPLGKEGLPEQSRPRPGD